MCNIEFHDYVFQKMKRSSGIERYEFSIEKVWKIIFIEMCGNPGFKVYLYFGRFAKNGLFHVVCKVSFALS